MQSFTDHTDRYIYFKTFTVIWYTKQIVLGMKLYPKEEKNYSNLLLKYIKKNFFLTAPNSVWLGITGCVYSGKSLELITHYDALGKFLNLWVSGFTNMSLGQSNFKCCNSIYPLYIWNCVLIKKNILNYFPRSTELKHVW